MSVPEDLFDPERLRRNWGDPSVGSRAPVDHPRLEGVEVAHDRAAAAAARLEAVERRVRIELPALRAPLEPFFQEARELLPEALGPVGRASQADPSEGGAEGAVSGGEPGGEEGDDESRELELETEEMPDEVPAPAAERLVEVLAQIEDLLEIALLTWR